jgi:hypothetical protein
VSKYKNIQDNYPEVKDVYYYPSEDRRFMKEGENNTIIFRTLVLITQNNFENKYNDIYKKITNNYGKLDKEYYESAKSTANSYLNNLQGYPLRMKLSSKTHNEAYNEIFELFSDINQNKIRVK